MSNKNTPGLGIEYEVHIPAYFALLLNTNENVEDFRLQSNAKDFGNLDDLLVDIETKSGQEFHFGFQLKHKENYEKNLLPTNFGAKGDFNLEKYCEAFKNLKEENKKYHFILYTNKKFYSERTKEVKIFNMVCDECCIGKEFFNTSPNFEDLYKFETNEMTVDGKNVTKDDYRDFFMKFSLYTGQMNFDELDKMHILHILKHKEQFLKYMDIFRRWHRGEFVNKVIDKRTVNIHIADIFLSSFYIQNWELSNGYDKNLELFETAIRKFDVTILDVSRKKFLSNLYEITESTNNNYYLKPHFQKLLRIYCEKYNIDLQNGCNEEDRIVECMIRLGKDCKIIDKSRKDLTEETKLKILYYFFEKPLIVDFNKTSESLIYHTLKLYKKKEINIKFVLFGKEIDLQLLSYNIFKNLSDLRSIDKNLHREIIKNCKLSIQGRESIFLKQLTVELYEEIEEFITPKEIYLMLKKVYLIGEEKEDLPSHYVSRTLSTTVFDVQRIIAHCVGIRNIVLIDFRDKNYLIKSFEEQNVSVFGIDTFLSEFIPNDRGQLVIALNKNCDANKLFEKFVEQNEDYNVSYFQRVDDENFVLVLSTRNMGNSEKLNFKKVSFDEKNIYRVFMNNPINIVCAQPGMGKSTFLKFLKNECDCNFWALLVDLKTFNSFIMREKATDKIITGFMQMDDENQDKFLNKFKKIFLKNKKIVIFLDGLDEVENDCVQKILDFVKSSSMRGYSVWLSSRQHLQRKLEVYFNLYIMEIDELTTQQRENYIENRLQPYYHKNEIKTIINKIFNNIYVTSNYQILGVPLQLYIITQILSSDRKYYENLNNNMFVLTKMYQIFFEGRYEYFINKTKYQNQHLTLFTVDDQLEKYEILALQSHFDNTIIQELNLDLRSSQRFLHQIKTDKDPLGIITKISNNKVVFEHFTFSEYFASKFFANNFSKATALRKHLFSEKYQNLMLMLNTMLAEENPLHLATIYRDLELVKSCYSTSTFDQGGRNLLQLATFNCTKYPSLPISRGSLFEYTHPRILRYLKIDKFTNCLIKDEGLDSFKEESDKELLYHLLGIDNPFKYETFLKWNSLNYALASKALFVVEAILEKYGKPANLKYILQDHYNDELIIAIIYYSLRFGYPNLLSTILAMRKFCLNKITCCSLRKFESDCILRFTVMPECAKKIESIEILLKESMTVNCSAEQGYTLLHFAVLEDQINVIEYLLDNNAEIECTDVYGRTPLFLAVEADHVDAVKLLLERGANVNVKTKSGRTPLGRARCGKEWNIEIVKLLIARGVNVNEEYLERNPIINTVVSDGLYEMTKILIEAKIHFDEKLLLKASIGGNYKIMEMILDHGKNRNLDVNYCASDGRHALHLAIAEGNMACMNLLLERGCSVNVLTQNGDSILHTAVRNSKFYPNIAMELLGNEEVKRLVYVTNNKGLTPLHLAVYLGKTSLVEKMLDGDVDLEKIDTENLDWPLLPALKNGVLDKNLLLRMTRKVEKEFLPYYCSHKQIVQYFLKYIKMNEVYFNETTTFT